VKTVAYVFVCDVAPYLWPEHILWDLSEVQHCSLYDWWIERQAVGKNDNKNKYKNNTAQSTCQKNANLKQK
jgi:hypothetical protein